MDRLLDRELWLALLADAQIWVEAEILTLAALWELGAIVTTLLLARVVAIPFRKWLEAKLENSRHDAKLSVVWRTFLTLITPIIWVILLWIAVAAADQLELRDKLMSVVVSLVNAWIVIRLITQFRRPNAARTFRMG